MAIVFDCYDVFGRHILLTDRRWEDHIQAEHPEMMGQFGAIERTLISPIQINRDKDEAEREVFYRRGALPPPDKNDYVKVVVHIGEDDTGAPMGWVVTAYAIEEIPGEEALLWTR